MSVQYGTQARTILLITVKGGNYYHVGLAELPKVGRGHSETFMEEW